MPMHRQQIAVMSGAMADDVRMAADRSRTAGFAGLQLPARSAALDVSALTPSGLRELRHVLSSQGQQLAGLSMELGGKGLMPGSDVDQQLARLRKAMEAAKGLAAGGSGAIVCVDVGPLPTGPMQEKSKPRINPQEAGLIIIPSATDIAAKSAEPTAPPPPVDPAAISQVDAAMGELGNLADRVGVMLAMRSRLSSFAALERALSAVTCPWFGVDLDPAAALADEWELDELLSRLGGLIRHVRGRDAQVGADRRTRPATIGQGGVRWDQLLAELESAAYAGWITIDPTDLPDRAASAVQGLGFLRSL